MTNHLRAMTTPQISRNVLLTMMLAILWGSVLTPSRTANANGRITLVHIMCVPELGYFKFGSIAVNGSNALPVLRAQGSEIARKYGFYNPHDYIDLAQDDDQNRPSIVRTRKAHAVCELDDGVVDVFFEPQVLFRELTYRLTVRINGILVMEDLHFDDRGGDSNGIGGFSYEAGSSSIFLEGMKGPDTEPFIPAFLVGKFFEFGPGIPPLDNFQIVYSEMSEGFEPPRNR